MRLSQWRQEQSLTQTALADQLGCSQAFVSNLERACEDERAQLPRGRAMFHKIYRLTRGAVTPNDLIGLPDLDTLALPLGGAVEQADAPLLDAAQ